MADDERLEHFRRCYVTGPYAEAKHLSVGDRLKLNGRGVHYPYNACEYEVIAIEPWQYGEQFKATLRICD